MSEFTGVMQGGKSGGDATGAGSAASIALGEGGNANAAGGGGLLGMGMGGTAIGDGGVALAGSAGLGGGDVTDNTSIGSINIT